MYVTCAGEVMLALIVARSQPTTLLTVLQTGAVATFTVLLAGLDPMLLAHPVGVLTKNLPLIAVLWTAWLVAREGWTERATWLLRAGMAVIWMTEGLFPKILFQQPWEVEIVAGSGLVPIDPSLFLIGMGVAQIASGIAVLALKPGRLLIGLLLCQVAALLVLPVLVSIQEPALWIHPFGPLTKNVPIVVGTLVLVKRCSSSS